VLYEISYEPFNRGSRWFLPASKELMDAVLHDFKEPGTYPIDSRGTAYYMAFSSIKHMGAGQFYLFVTRDKAGKPLDGSKSYCLQVPPKPP
jgi:hypothetical protein